MSFEQNASVTDGPYAISSSASFALDLIRTIAAQAVLVGHAISILGLLPQLQPPYFAYIQNIAVVAFFLLSGFLISYSVFAKSERPTFRSYFIDRFSRIYAGLLPALIFIALIDWIIISRGWSYEFAGGYSAIDFVGNAFMLQDYPVLGAAAGITSFGSGRVLWTLAVEWWLYMAFGWLVLSRRRGARFWLGAILVLPVPLYNTIAGRGDGLTVMWLVGVCCCLLLRGRHLSLVAAGRGWLLCAAFAAAAGARLLVTKDAYDLLFAMLAAGWLATLIALLDRAQPQMPGWLLRLVKFAADYSFTLYLVHLSVIAVGVHLIGDLSPWAAFGLFFVAANISAALLALGTEMQHHRLRKYLKRKFVGGAATRARAEAAAQ